MIAEVPESISMYEAGVVTRDELLARLFALIEPHGVDGLLGELPPPWRDELVAWMRSRFDNDVPPDAFVWVGNNSEPPGQRELIALARDWLQRHPA